MARGYGHTRLMADARFLSAEAHWAAVSQASQMAAAWRDEARRQRTRSWRLRIATRLIGAGIRLGGPTPMTPAGAAGRGSGR